MKQRTPTHGSQWQNIEKEESSGKVNMQRRAAAVSVDKVQSKRNPPQDPVRPARYLNGVKLDAHELANIS